MDAYHWQKGVGKIREAVEGEAYTGTVGNLGPLDESANISKAKEAIRAVIKYLNELEEEDWEKDPELQSLYDELSGYFL